MRKEIDRTALTCGVTKKLAAEVIKNFLFEVRCSVAEGKPVHLAGFFVLRRKRISPRTYTLPLGDGSGAPGKTVNKQESIGCRLTIAKKFKEQLNQGK